MPLIGGGGLGFAILHRLPAMGGLFAGSALFLLGLFALERVALRCVQTGNMAKSGRLMGAALILRLPIYVGCLLLLAHFLGDSADVALGGLLGVFITLICLVKEGISRVHEQAKKNASLISRN